MSTGYYPDAYNNTNTTITVRASYNGTPVTEIAADAFKNYLNLVTVTYESDTNITKIGDYAFYNCSKYANVIIPSSVTSIGNYAFQGIIGNITFNSNSNLLTIGNYGFSGSTIRNEFIIPSSVTSIGDNCFSSVNFNFNVIMNCKITEIPIYAFSTSNIYAEYFNAFFASFPNTIKKINENAFYDIAINCYNSPMIMNDFYFTINIPNGVTFIDSSAYGNYLNRDYFDYEEEAYTNGLTITIPSSVTYLASDAFYVTDIMDPLYISITSINNYSSHISLDPALFPGLTITNPAICFLVNTNILTLQSNNKEKYVQIQHLRKGDLVKTSENGYKKIDVIGYSTIEHRVDNNDKKNKLYVCSRTKYPELFEDLVITGCHSILVNKLTDKQRANMLEMTGSVFVTGIHYRLYSCLDEKTMVYPTNGDYEIWHFALENDKERENYGVYANGLLVESCSKRMIQDYSRMHLL